MTCKRIFKNNRRETFNINDIVIIILELFLQRKFIFQPLMTSLAVCWFIHGGHKRRKKENSNSFSRTKKKLRKRKMSLILTDGWEIAQITLLDGAKTWDFNQFRTKITTAVAVGRHSEIFWFKTKISMHIKKS